MQETAREAEQLLDLNRADRLEESNASYARAVELRYLGGLSIEKTRVRGKASNTADEKRPPIVKN
jgi:hypothetical protein